MTAPTWPASIDADTARAIYLSGQVSGIASFVASAAVAGRSGSRYTTDQIRNAARDMALAFVGDVAQALHDDPAARHELDEVLAHAATNPDAPTPAVWI